MQVTSISFSKLRYFSVSINGQRSLAKTCLLQIASTLISDLVSVLLQHDSLHTESRPCLGGNAFFFVLQNVLWLAGKLSGKMETATKQKSHAAAKQLKPFRKAFQVRRSGGRTRITICGVTTRALAMLNISPIYAPGLKANIARPNG